MNEKIHPARVVLGIDGSNHSLAGIHLLKDLPCIPNSSIYALSVQASNSPQDQARLQTALEEAGRLLESTCAAKSSELRQGHPAEVLVQAASQQHADLLVVGAQGQRAALGFIVGGVAQQVVEHATTPVLVARPPYAGLGRVLLASDGSPCSQHALDYLASFSLPPQTVVEVVRVMPPQGLQEIGGVWPMGHELVPILSDREIQELDELAEQQKQLARQQLETAAETLRAAGLTVETRLLEGDPTVEILDRIRVTHANLIVAGSRGLSQVQGWLMGSVSRKLVYSAGCSVLIVK